MLRVVTWNVWWQFGPWEARQQAILTTLRALDPDIVFLQEAWAQEGGQDQIALFAEELAMFYARTPAPFWRGASFGNAVLTRWPLLDAEHHSLVNEAGQPGHRTAVVATIAAPFGPVRVIGTHLDFQFDRSAVRVAQAREIAQLVADVRGDVEADFPVIVAGDFNAVPDSDEIRALTGRTAPLVPGVILQDCWELAGTGLGHTWSSNNEYLVDASWPNRRIDYVFVSWPRPKGLAKPVTATLIGTELVDGVTPSDHYGVCVDLRT